MNNKKSINVAKTFFKSIAYPYLGKGNVPIWVHLWLTRKCNLACKYCFVHRNDYPELDTSGMLRAIDHIKDVLKCNLVALMGGEPTMRRDLPAIIRHMTGKDMVSFMSTNGFLLTEKKIFELCDAGLDILELSFDGMTETEMSHKTGTRLVGTLERLVQFQEIYGLELSMNMVITKQNYDELDDVIRLLGGRHISLTTGLYIPEPLSRLDPRDDPLAFTTPEDLVILKNLTRKIRRLKKHGVFIAHPNNYYSKWVPFMNQLVKQAENRRPVNLWRCAPCKDFLEVDCDGRIRYCSYLNDLVDPELTIFDLNSSYYKRLKAPSQRILSACNSRCLANCFFEVSEIRRNPLAFVTNTLVRHMGPQLRNTPDVMAQKEPLKQALRAKFVMLEPGQAYMTAQEKIKKA